MAAQTPLSLAINGGDAAIKKMSPGQTQKALAASVKKLNTKDNLIAKMKDNGEATASALINTVEFTSTAFAASFVAGYVGEDSLQVGGVDVRAAVGLVAAGYGIYDLALNAGKGGGSHAVAAGTGILTSFLTSMGERAGQAVAKGDLMGSTTSVAPKAPKASLQGGNFGKAVMTPQELETADDLDDEDDYVTRKVNNGQSRRNGRRTRLVRARTS